MQYTQDGRLIAVETALGKDKFLLASVTGVETLSRLFSYNLEMLSADHGIRAEQLLGQNVTIRIRQANGTYRPLNGFVSRFSAAGLASREFRYYHAEIVPWLWFLTRSADCRIFQNLTVPQIVQQVFQDFGYSDHDWSAVKGDYPTREYCVQYRETAFDFVSRLLEFEGIFYFFRHEQGRHVAVFGDQRSAFQDCAEHKVNCSAESAVLGQISAWEHAFEFRPGRWAQTDYNFETPSTRLLTQERTVLAVPRVDQYEIFDYPGGYSKKPDGSQATRVRIEEEESAYHLVRGTSSCVSFTPGGKFTIAHHALRQEEGKEYVVASIEHTASEGSYVAGTDGLSTYANRFSCLPSDVRYRPARETSKPAIQGSQTAVVVGPPGEEIYVDRYGRIKVQFHWDRRGRNDDNSSCWIRVGQSVAGRGWGTVYLPRIGQEVVVTFLEGDPDRPLVTGSVYNAEQMPPFPLPAGGMIAGMKTDSTKGHGGYNEMSMNDTKGKEQITVHAQHDMATTIEHDESHTVVKGNRTIAVQTGTHTETIKGDTAITITTGPYLHRVAANKAERIAKNESTLVSETAHILVTAATKIELRVGASSLVMESDGKISLKGRNIAVDGAESVSVSGMAIRSIATAEHETKGAIVISEGSATNTVKGGMVMLNP